MKTEYVVRVSPNLKMFSGFPSLVPFVNLSFILILYFMMGTNFVPVEGIAVDLPRGSSEKIFASKNLVITVDKDANIYFNDMLIRDISVLKRQLSEVIANDSASGTSLIIRADRNISLDMVAKLMTLREELKVNAFFMTNNQRSPAQNQSNFLDIEK